MKSFPEIPDGYRAEWVGGVLTLVKEAPIAHKYKVGDRVLCSDGAKYKISGLSEVDGIPVYSVLGFDRLIISEAVIVGIVPIADQIKTLEDAVEWCKANGKKAMTEAYDSVDFNFTNSDGEIYEDCEDLLAYLKLRIITCALNEGWEPTFEEYETRYYPYSYTDTDNLGVDFEVTSITFPLKLCFKTEDLAEYASKQFRGVYASFCGNKK